MAKFDDRSLKNLKRLHPLLQTLLSAAILEFEMGFVITDSVRGQAAQNKAFESGNSKVKFGASAHNYVPAVAADIYPAPYATNGQVLSLHKKLQIDILKPLAAKLNIPIRQGIDFNRNGILTDDNFKDYPHIELYPWRKFVTPKNLYYGK